MRRVMRWIPVLRGDLQAPVTSRKIISTRRNSPVRAEKRYRLIVLVMPAIRNIVQCHRADLPKHGAHHGRSWNNIFLHASTFQTSTDPDVIHVKGAGRCAGVIPERTVKKTRLNQVAATTRYYRRGFWSLKIDTEINLGMTPAQTRRNWSAAKTQRCI